MWFCVVLGVLGFASLGCVGQDSCQTTCQQKRLNDVKTGQKRFRGVNLGSWLVLEHWMSPAPWDQNGCNPNTYVGQYNLERCLGNRSKAVMEHHWSTWITEDDFKEMSMRGINVVRIPVGWWHIYDIEGGADKAKLKQCVRPTNYVTGGLAYLDRAFVWGLKYGIGVFIQLYAAPGSQNGNEDSSPNSLGEKNWSKCLENVEQTVDSMELYAQRYANNVALVGFGLLNAPSNQSITILQEYYKNAYRAIRKHSCNSWIVISPLSNPLESGTECHWNTFMNPDAGFDKVGMDVHYYSCFGDPPDQKTTAAAVNYIKDERHKQIMLYINVNPKPMLIGEWSGCYHGDQAQVWKFFQAQIGTYHNATLGWTYWSWAPGTPNNVWSFKSAFNAGWLPSLATKC